MKQPKEVMAGKREAIARFVYVIKPLGEVYSLPPPSLHIFYDLSGGTIAFNRGASIFCNLRFFEAWRKCSVTVCNIPFPLTRSCFRRRSG